MLRSLLHASVVVAVLGLTYSVRISVPVRSIGKNDSVVSIGVYVSATDRDGSEMWMSTVLTPFFASREL